MATLEPPQPPSGFAPPRRPAPSWTIVPEGPPDPSQITEPDPDDHPGGKRHWYLLIGALAPLILAAVLAWVNGDDSTAPPSAATTLAPEPDPSIAVPTSTAPASTAPASTAPASTAPASTAVSTTVAAAPPVTAPPTTGLVASAPPVPLPSMIDVADESGTLIVQIPAAFQTNIRGVTLNGVQMQHVSGAEDIDRYLAGDFTVFGATVLTGPTALIATPADILTQLDPAAVCASTTGEEALTTTQGEVAVLSYDGCAGENAMVMLAVRVDEIDQVVFVSVQGPGASSSPMRDLALAILASVRRS